MTQERTAMLQSQKYSKEIERLLIEASAAQVISEAKGNTTLLMPHIKTKTRVREEDGQFIVDILDDKGVPRISPNSGNNSPMTIAELVTEMKNSTTFSPAFEGSGMSGAGTSGSTKATPNQSKSLSEQGIQVL